MKRRIISFISFVALAVCLMASPMQNKAKAATNVQEDTLNVNIVEQAMNEAENENEGDVIGVGVIVINDVANNVIPGSSLLSISENGNIVGNGVRLRKSPSVNATILELMYNNEAVCINYTKSSQASGKWLYVKRVKTGTWGWVKSTYVYSWD